MKLSQRIRNLQPSMTLGIDAKAKTLKAQGVNVIGLGAGEPDFPTPEAIKRAAVAALERNETHYTPVGGTDALKDAILHKFKRDLGLIYQRNQIAVSCGAKHSFYNLAHVLWEEGDEVILQSPYWVSYPEIIALTGAQPVIIETTAHTGFKMKPEQLHAAITPATQAIVLNSPSNPTGSGYTRSELEALCEVALNHELLVISDEIYDKIVFDGFEHASPAALSEAMKDNTVVINGASKAYAMTGWRIGYIAGPAEIAAAVIKLQGQSTSNPTSIAQAATVEALTGNEDAVRHMTAEFLKRRDYLMDRFAKIEGITCFKPLGTFYSFPDVSGLYGRPWQGQLVTGSIAFCDFLLDAVKVAVVPGVAFGADAHVRLSFAASLDVLKEAMDRIESAVRLLG